MAGKVFVNEGHSRGSTVDQGMASYGFVTKGNIAQNNIFSFHSYIGQTRQAKDRRRERRILAQSTANSSAIMQLLA